MEETSLACARPLRLPRISPRSAKADAAYPGASGAELARLSLLTPQTMNVILANLERDGAIVRRPHAEHGRIQVNEITTAGKALLARCKRAVKTAEAALVQALSPAQEQVVRRWLVRAAQMPTQ